jgi:glyoxylase-like metal-dependent hydrolase (beta-lactamase superfamily II)
LTLSIPPSGLDLQLVYIPGETLCQMGVWIPSKRVFLPGDNFYRAFPNLYAIRGTVPRNVAYWIESLDLMRHYRPGFLVPAHSRPITGETEVSEGYRIIVDLLCLFVNVSVSKCNCLSGSI